MTSMVLLEFSLENLSFHDPGNVVVTDGSRSLFRSLFAAFPYVLVSFRPFFFISSPLFDFISYFIESRDEITP